MLDRVSLSGGKGLVAVVVVVVGGGGGVCVCWTGSACLEGKGLLLLLL